MPEPLTIPARAPAHPAANVGVTPGSATASGDAGEFEDMLHAGLAGRAGAATGLAVPAGPAAARAAATPNVQASTAASIAAGDDRSERADDGASDSLAALLAYGPGAAVSPAATGAEPHACEQSAAPALKDRHPETAMANLAAAMPQPAPVQPTLLQPTLAQPTRAQPILGQPTLGQSTLVQAAPGQPTVTPLAMELVFDRDRKADLSAATAVRAGRTGGGDAPDWAETGESDGRTPRDLPGISGIQATGLAQHVPAFTEAGTRTVKVTADAAEEVRSAGRSTGRDDLRYATEFPDAARQRDGLQQPIKPALDVRPADRQTERGAERPIDPAAGTDTMVRTDLAPRLDAPVPAVERAAPVPVLFVDYSLGSPEWQREFGSKVNVLVSRREPRAEIRLNPPQLGPVEVRIGLQGDQVSLAFTAPQPEARAAIENALPQLREMFAANGLTLGNASVSAESSRQQSPRDTHSQHAPFMGEEPIAVDIVPGLRRVVVRLVDTFA